MGDYVKYKEITYSRTVNKGNYESAKLEIKIELADSDDKQESLEELRNFVSKELLKEVKK
jgi:hypothetical protein